MPNVTYTVCNIPDLKGGSKKSEMSSMWSTLWCIPKNFPLK